MKMLTLFSLLMFQAVAAKADSYQVTVSDPNLAKVILAKDCLDYAFCGGEGSSLAGGEGAYRFHTMINLSDVEMKTALLVCNFKKQGIKVSIQNLTKKVMVPVPKVDTGYDLRPGLPSIYVAEMTPAKKIEKFNKVKVLLDSKKRQAAINMVLSEYRLSTRGYAVKFGGDMGKAGAVTRHDLKTVTLSDSAFDEPCNLIQTMRHELEHVSQIAKVDACAAKGKRHNLTDHVARERSAYLNDARNLPIFCTDQDTTKYLVDFVKSYFLESYTTE